MVPAGAVQVLLRQPDRLASAKSNRNKQDV
jgi:hypothetical protein